MLRNLRSNNYDDGLIHTAFYGRVWLFKSIGVARSRIVVLQLNSQYNISAVLKHTGKAVASEVQP
jgi:hypothetical protein